MIEPSAVEAGKARYELRFSGLFNRGRGFAFPCDAHGNVDLNELTDGERTNYLFARAVVGTELSPPVVSRAA
jgi:hypothetical protein